MVTNTGFNNNSNSKITRVPKVNYHEIISQLSPAVIPRVTAIANTDCCERAAYDISFFGLDGYPESDMGVIGSAIHRIVIKSTLEIAQYSKRINNILFL